MMVDEYDPSCKETTCRASITCKCGKRVFYGCGKLQFTRPIYCSKCTKSELEKLTRNAQFLRDNVGKSEEQIMSYYLRRKIEHG